MFVSLYTIASPRSPLLEKESTVLREFGIRKLLIYHFKSHLFPDTHHKTAIQKVVHVHV